jgi:hypothetical protein
VLLDELIADVETQRQGAADKGAYTAVATLTRQLVALRKERAQVEDEDDGPPTADEIRAVILSLPDDLAKVATDALKERRTAGRR